MLKVIEKYCNGCSLCKNVCKVNAIEIIGGKAKINKNCNDCEKCIEECINNAIVIGE